MSRPMPNWLIIFSRSAINFSFGVESTKKADLMAGIAGNAGPDVNGIVAGVVGEVLFKNTFELREVGAVCTEAVRRLASECVCFGRG